MPEHQAQYYFRQLMAAVVSSSSQVSLCHATVLFA